MIPITLEYKPVPFIPWRYRLDAQLPAHWYELTAQQLEAITLINKMKFAEDKILQIMLGVRRALIRKMSSYEKYCILRNLKYLSEIDSCHYFIISRIGKFRAPDLRLKDVTFGAFIFGDTYYQNYITGHKEDLDRFIACYYLRGSFSDKDIDLNAQRISRFSIKKREAIALNYGLIREWLARAYPYVFQKSDEKKKDSSAGWVAVFDAVVGDDLVNQEKYAEKPLSIVLRFLNRKTKEYYKNGSKVQ